MTTPEDTIVDARAEPRYEAPFLRDLTGLSVQAIRGIIGHDPASFLALVELHILGRLRERYHLRPQRLREMHEEARTRMKLDFPFASRATLFAESGRLWLQTPDGGLVDLGRDGQTGLAPIVEQIADRVVWDEHNEPVRLEPAEGVTIDPNVRWGEPVVAGTRVPTAALAAVWRMSGSVDQVAELYELTRDQVQAAVNFESLHGRAA